MKGQKWEAQGKLGGRKPYAEAMPKMVELQRIPVIWKHSLNA
jgi:hypothetical protein